MCANFTPILPGTGNENDIGGDSTGAWTPTNAGLVVKLNKNDQFRISTMIGGVEYFVCDYSEYDGGKFKYSNDPTGDYLKLIPRNGDGTPPPGSLWSVGDPLARKVNSTSYNLVDGMDGILYTMWSVPESEGDVSKTLLTNSGSDFMLKEGGFLGNKEMSKPGYFCDVAFAIPTVRSRVNMDPTNKLGRGYPFDGQMGVDEKGEVWREVYWFHKSRVNGPFSYAAFLLTAFNTGTGKAYQINGKYKGRNDKRMLFRLYIVQDHPFETCPNSYFFAHDEQNYLRFLRFNALPINPEDSTTARKIYTHDHQHCMEWTGDSSFYQTEGLYQIPASDSTFYYVGKKNKFYSDRADPLAYISSGTTALSQFTKIRQLRIRHLANESTPFIAPAGAYGRIVIDTTSSAANHGATFDPVGYFFRTSSGVNVPMVQVDDTTWITATMWHIAGEYMNLKGIVKLYTGTSFSATDPGASIADWSDSVPARSIPVYGHPGWTAEGHKGWARIHTNRPDTNGGIEFVLADTLHNYIEYSNNGCFGTELPKQYPLEGTTRVTVQAPQLLEGYVFYGWNTTADTTTGTLIPAGTVIDFEHLPTGVDTTANGVLKLYAKAKYTGSINVAISFLKDDGKRYFMTFPTSGAAFLRARTFDEWTNTCQGMESGIEDELDYMASFQMIGQPTCVECAPTEYVLDPHRFTMHGSEDSLVFYENYQIGPMDYIGLYYDPLNNSVLYNDNWAGLFQSSKGWPTPAHACVDSTRLFSTHYLYGWPGAVRKQRLMPNPAGPAGDSIQMPSNIKYNATENQFDGAAEGDSTIFTLSGVGVVDGYYIILPDTTDAASWTDSIVFAFHENQTTVKNVWSKLIGKQLLAQMKVGKDTIYFHPNRNKIITDVNALATSRDFRLTHDFEYLRDARVEALYAVEPDDKPSFVENGFQGTVTSGESSPLEVQLPGGQYIDMVDTVRVWLRPTESSRIKKYYGRWNENADGVHVQSDGSRYRDILVKTKTYHYGPTQKTLRLVPEQESYSFGSLKDDSKDVNFKLELISWHELLDVDGNLIRVDTISIADTTSILDLTTATTFELRKTDIFTKGTPTRLGIRLTTQFENTTALNRDTLRVTTNVNLGGVLTPVSVEVPLLQVSTIGTELLWSVEYMGHRKFIVATNTTFDFREYSETDSRLKYSGNELIKGSNGSSNSNKRYITPWKWFDTDPNQNQLTLKTEYGINRWFRIKDETTPEVSASDSSTLTFYMYDTYTNSNGNYEEIVKLKYGDNKWLSYNGSALVLVNDSADASLFSWAYMIPEYYLQNNGNYPSAAQATFAYNVERTAEIRTCYQAYLDHSMLLNNELVRLCKTEEKDIADLINPSLQWKTLFTDSIIRDSRVTTPSGLSMTLDTATLKARITSSGLSPLDITYNGQRIDIVDTLDFRITLQPEAPDYRFAGNWSSYSSVENAHLKVPLIRQTYHEVFYDSILCSVDRDEYNYAFPAVLREGVRADSVHTFYLSTRRHKGKYVYNISGKKVESITLIDADSTSAMHLDDITMAQIVLKDAHGDEPTWCKIEGKGSNSVTVRCSSNGIRTPRMAYLNFIFIEMLDGKARYVNYRLTVSQASYFQYANNQTLFHTAGASGDPIDSVTGLQQVHENKRILYYYNPRPYNVADQNVELPLRERGFYGWWRWYREGKDQNGVDVSDTDIPDSVWITPPRNVSMEGKNYNFPFRIIGDSVKVPDPDGGEGDSIKQLVTMGRFTVFHYPSINYGTKWDPASKTPQVHAPYKEDTVTYAVDISNYYDNLPLSTKSGEKNWVDTAKLYKMDTIYEPTLSFREIFELHPWTEMAARLEGYKDTIASATRNLNYMEDHVVLAPSRSRLLLQTEQRYIKEHFAEQKQNGMIRREGHSESLLGYYMRDDNWATWAGDKDRQDTMIWCGGWDVDCQWFTYNPKAAAGSEYTLCNHPITVDDDFLNVPIWGDITSGHDFDTVYYCLRARSQKTLEDASHNDSTVDGDYWFNICRYKIIYHTPEKYGPMLETNVGGEMKALKTNEEIEQNYEILEQLNFDYNKPGSDYTIYPHPLPWGDVSYGYTYPLTSARQNRYHAEKDFPGPGEYALINKINYTNWWRPIEQHGGAENGYMLYCDGMSASGQVAALSLQTKLCEGQKLYFSGYVGNASNQTGKANPNFTISVQGSEDGKVWEDVTSYMTGSIEPSDNWYQIFFPIEFTKEYTHFRVRIYNLSSDFDGNDFVIDDMCIFATKPPLVAYQANTKCVEQNDTDSIIHVVLRVDYQGFIDDEFNNKPVFYAVDELTLPDSAFRYVPMIDGYLNNTIHTGTPDTIFGWIRMPARTYEPSDEDSILINLQQLADRFEASLDSQKVHPERPLFRQGYIYERLDDEVRPVLYVVHKAKMIPKNRYTVRMSLNTEGLTSNSQCAVTSILNVTSRMKLVLNGEEKRIKRCRVSAAT
ncbi:MAG: hypothetical protein IKS76_04030 [Paludibacteraceae bacterium]|nr:hypothetical protein [Paludibacteraceae bacterium]